MVSDIVSGVESGLNIRRPGDISNSEKIVNIALVVPVKNRVAVSHVGDRPGTPEEIEERHKDIGTFHVENQ
jgi:hypothetical protein